MQAPTNFCNLKERRWENAFDETPQEKIHAWIERILHHIEEIIRAEGARGYKERRSGRILGTGRRKAYEV